METTSTKTLSMVKIAMTGAIYTVLTLVIAPLSYGQLQFRVSEMMTVLPAFTPLAIPGLTLGCCLSNLIGAMTGVNPTGYIDAVVGTAATLLASLCSYWIAKQCRKPVLRYALVPLPPVLLNAAVVGMELTILFNEGGNMLTAFLVNAASVGIGQLVICYVLGIPFMMVLQHHDLYKKIF